MSRKPLLSLLFCCFLLPLTAAEEGTAGTTASDLQAQLTGIPALSSDDSGQLLWAAGDEAPLLVVTEALSDAFLVQSPVGRIRVQRSGASRDGAVAAIRTLVAHAEEGAVNGSDNAPLVFDHSFLTGFRLKSATAIITEAGVVQRRRLPPASRQPELKALGSATASLESQLPETGLDSTVQKVLTDLLGKLSEEDGEQEFDEMPPSYARRLVRHGFIARVLPGNEQASQVVTAVEAASAFAPKVGFAGGGSSIELLADGFGEQAWVYRTPDSVSIAVRPREPEYGWHVQRTLADCWLIVRWSAAADPTKSDPGGELREAALVEGDTVLARWTAAEGFQVDEAVWRGSIPASSARGSELVDGYLPPHIVVTNLHGDILGIAVEGGLLPTITERSEAAAQAFLDRAAELLVDAGHLDLIGQYLMQYVFDSPDSTLPFVPGNRTVNSDIHQTALQTVLSTVGGICRGDCDDLSELYQEILTRQGKLAHVISLPGHAACGWAEEHDDSWSSYVLQTGPALQFDAEKLPDALVATYKHFGDEDTVDPNALGLLLRFSGENTRSSWRLSWRIFSEPDYAKTMIDVQRDWHFQTYQRAIHKMQALIAAGDHDNANYSELAGLYNYTGQSALAARYLEKAMALTEESDSLLFRSIELFDHWAEAGELEKAEAVMLDILDRQLPARKKELGGAAVQIGIGLIRSLLSKRMYDHIARIEENYLLETIGEQGDRIIAWLASSYDENRWQTAGFIRQMRRWMGSHAGLAVAVLERVDREQVLGDPVLSEMVYHAQRYMQYVAPFDADDPSEITQTYSIHGTYHWALMGQDALLDALDASAFPSHTERSTKQLYGELRTPEDLRWIKASLPFWWHRMTQLFDPDEPPPDTALVIRLAEGAEAAYAWCLEQDFVNPYMHKQAHLVRLVKALIQEDEQTLRALLKTVAEKNDKRLRDDTAQWMGDCARSLDPDWYRTVIRIWREELDYKPKYFWIAWRAMLNKAPQHALIVADAAAERFADDPAFVEEAAFMHVLADPEGRKQAEATAIKLLEQAPE